MRNAAITIGIQLLGCTSHINTMINQVLGDPIPTGNLVTGVLVPHAPELDSYTVGKIRIE